MRTQPSPNVDVDAIYTLLLVHVHQSLCAVEVLAQAFQRFSHVLGRFGHVAADIFTRRLQVDPERGHVIAPHRRSSEGRVEALLEVPILLEIVERGLGTRCRHRLCALEASFGNEALDSPGTRFILHMVDAAPDDAIGRAALLCIFQAGANPWACTQLVPFDQITFEQFQSAFGHARCGVVAMYRTADVTL